ncbi:MAG: BatA domain-containing protein, partial [Planctomycetales bacterium]|nr:BatA domain-containing protein [Planctomycetales bacterium]
MTYLFPALLAIGLPLAILPPLIHLINLRRRRRVEWAAMQFLLESQKKNKKWIVLKQLLLLLLRTAAVAGAAFLLAGPVVQSSWAALFGQGVTHHVLLFDDSYSMGDRAGAGTALQAAADAAQQIVHAAQGRSDRQIVTLLPFSTAPRLLAGATPLINRAQLDAALTSDLETLFRDYVPSETSADVAEALAAANRLPEPAEDESRVVYVLSDFRQAQWRESSRMRQLVNDVRQRCAQLHLIQCAEGTHDNLSLVELRPEAGIRAGGIETWMEATVKNHGLQSVAAATLEVRHNEARLPAVQFGEIPPGESATRRFRATLSADGSVIEATLPEDALAADNVRYFSVRPPAAYRVLIIDESPRGDDGRYLATALSPGGRNLAGWAPQIERRAFLRRDEELDDFAAICLLDVPRLDEAEADNLSQYAAQGGGVAIFLGPQTQRDFYNGLVDAQSPALGAVPLLQPAQLVRASGAAAPDLIVSDDALFRVFQGLRNSFLDLTKFDFYYAVDPQWRVSEVEDVRVLASLRNGAPVVLEKRVADGVVIWHLFKLSPSPTALGRWSNFAATPAFPVYANELMGRLSSTRRSATPTLVDEPLRVSESEADFLAEATIVPPARSGLPSFRLDLEPVDGRLEVVQPAPVATGVWRVRW